MVAPQGDHGASECEAGVGLWDLNGVNAVHAPLEPRASLIVRAPLAQGVLQDGRTGLSENAILCIFGHILGWHCKKNRHFGGKGGKGHVVMGPNIPKNIMPTFRARSFAKAFKWCRRGQIYIVKWKKWHFETPKKRTKRPNNSPVSCFPLQYGSKLSNGSAKSATIYPPTRPQLLTMPS